MSDKKGTKLEEGILLACGNPLLDYQAHVTKEFLDKWHLIENDAILLDDERASLFDDLEQNFEVQCIPGGATQNAIRVCQWILGVPNCTVFFGAIGNDKYGSVLKQKMLNAGVNVQYQINPTVKTGTCAAMLHDNHRSLCAHLSAANTFTEDHIEIPENRKLIERAKYYYISGFFITSCASAYLKIAKHSAENKKACYFIFMTNLAAPFIPKFYKEVLNEVMPYVDVLFGNESEAAAFAEVFDLKTTDVAEIAKTISKMPMKNSGRQRLVIFTQGADPTYVVSGDTVMKYAVHKLSHSEIVDTNGAGDAFAGGFLAQYIQEKPVEECVCCGHFAAATIIKQNGCTLPAVCGYKS